jgi:hypothetical protein
MKTIYSSMAMPMHMQLLQFDCQLLNDYMMSTCMHESLESCIDKDWESNEIVWNFKCMHGFQWQCMYISSNNESSEGGGD